MQSALLFETVDEMYRRVFRELKPRTRLPEFSIEYYPYANIDSTIRLEPGQVRIRVRMSDLLEGAPAPVQEALAHILLAKLYGKPVPEKYNRRYRLYLNRTDIRRKALLIRQIRGRKRVLSARGHVFDLEEIFQDLNRRFFHGLLAQPVLSWSPNASRRMLGHFDPAHNAIIISKIFDRPRIPRFLVEYIVYHEMLHLRHPAENRSHRRCVHTKAFKEEERKFPRYQEANDWLKRL